MENVHHRLAAALQREGIAYDRPIPHDSVALLTAELGISAKSLRNRRWELGKARGDASTAAEADLERCRGVPGGHARRYREDPAYAALTREKARSTRLRDYPYHVFKNTRGNARKRGLSFDLTREQVAEMLLPMRCSVTGLPLKPEWDGTGRNPWWPSLDQIEPRGGYTAKNVRAVCWAYNVMKGELEDAEVRRYAAALRSGRVRPDEEAGARIMATRLYANGVSASAHLLCTWRVSARDRGLDFALGYDWLNPRLMRGVCEVTGLSLSMTYDGRAHRNPLVPSVDRIDCGKGYTEDNVRLVCGWLNYARQDWPDEVVRSVARGLLRPSSRTAFRS